MTTGGSGIETQSSALPGRKHLNLMRSLMSALESATTTESVAHQDATKWSSFHSNANSRYVLAARLNAGGGRSLRWRTSSPLNNVEVEELSKNEGSDATSRQ